MNMKLLKLLNKNGRTPVSELATMTGRTEEEIVADIEELEQSGVIRGYKTVIDWERLDNTYVSAIIELKVTPKAGLGFEEVARKVMKYPEVESVYLMSGGFDLAVRVNAPSMQDIALFVAKRLAPLDSVLSTATHFILTRYKDGGVVLNPEDERDERRTVLCD